MLCAMDTFLLTIARIEENNIASETPSHVRDKTVKRHGGSTHSSTTDRDDIFNLLHENDSESAIPRDCEASNESSKNRIHTEAVWHEYMTKICNVDQ